MDWVAARAEISRLITVRTNLNTERSTWREVVSIGPLNDNDRYGYESESGFVVRIGEERTVSIPWPMLEVCWQHLGSGHAYNGRFFREAFPLQAKDHPCHVHVVGKILERAGLATCYGRDYVAKANS